MHTNEASLLEMQEVKGSYKTVLHLMDTREAERETQTRKKEKLWIRKRTR